MELTLPLFRRAVQSLDGDGLSVQGLVTSLNTDTPWQLALPAQGVFGFTGPSGGGKSTLLAALAGLRGCTGKIGFGNVTWQSGKSGLATHRRDLSLGFQDSSLFGGQTVADNLALAHRYSRRPLSPEERAELIECFGITPLLRQPVELLSGGEAQRVAVLRQLFSNAAVQLYDEPLAAVDRLQVIRKLLPRLRDFWARHPALVIWTSHDFDEIQLLATQCLWMERGALTGPLPLREVTRRLQLDSLERESCFSRLEARVLCQEEGLLTLSLGDATLYADRVAGRYRAGQSIAFLLGSGDIGLCLEQPGLSSILNCLPVELREIVPLEGGRVRLRLAAGEQEFSADISRLSRERLQLREGERYYAQFKASSLAGL
ncbi:molybdate transport system ATP-binding protein [Microbulbifer donghaiensis]|uniref:Molybdate transport system ATP-binding protein n=1 Tax=Microbulbifer donghaiensis TaxID=494016 RepID=A0A1M4YP13_9GAMM|nr:ATP-binding cassette domain-containing protein [Microbulbifer donghaiensis]SHF07520.1 molybdate transport system ATP-binding protein [Microbulbifer donghaiensis]